MPKKKQFEQLEYDPIAMDSARDAATQAARFGTTETSPTTPPTLAVVEPAARQPPAVPQRREGDRTDAKPSRRKESRSSPVESRPAEEVAAGDRVDYVKKRFPVTKDEASDIDEFVQRLRRRSGTSISLATVTRVCIALGMQVEQDVIAELEKDPSPSQPPFQDAEAMAEFEDHWLRLFGRALRKLPQTPRRTLER